MEEMVYENAGTGGGQFVYEPYKQGVSIAKYRGTGSQALIPGEIEGKPVIAVDKKAFLSCKTLREILVPDPVQELGDWAFAHAEQLRRVTIPRHSLDCGKDLFLGCRRLKEIVLDGTEEERALLSGTGLGRKLAMGVMVLHDYSLLDPPQVGTDQWVKRWDEKLLELIATDDLEGFEELWTCGEEDYEGKDYDIKSYPVEKRKMKLRIVYFRLRHQYKISDRTAKALRTYVAQHTKGTPEPEAWYIIVEEHRDELDYYRMFVEAGGVTQDNFDALLADLTDARAEIKAFLLRYRAEKLGRGDAFSGFELDW